jgi:excisionase family DNA binding protein
MATDSPWLTLTEAAAYCKRGKRFLAREVKAGRLRAAKIGGRGEILTRAEWLDQWVEDQSIPILVHRRERRA